MAIKTDVTFRDAILHLQVVKLKLDGIDWKGKDSSKGNMKIVMHERDGKQVRVRFRPKEEIISTINVIGNKLKDLLKGASGGVVFTTIQKFQPEEGNVYEKLSDRTNIIVIADEAHRTQYGFKAKTIDDKDEHSNVIGKKIVYGFSVSPERLLKTPM